MTDNPLDFSPLAPDQLQIERAARAILAAADEELARRRMPAHALPTPLGQVARWRIQLVAASLLVALPGLIALGVERGARPAPEPTLELAAALGIPEDFLATMHAGVQP